MKNYIGTSTLFGLYDGYHTQAIFYYDNNINVIKAKYISIEPFSHKLTKHKACNAIEIGSFINSFSIKDI